MGWDDAHAMPEWQEEGLWGGGACAAASVGRRASLEPRGEQQQQPPPPPNNHTHLCHTILQQNNNTTSLVLYRRESREAKREAAGMIDPPSRPGHMPQTRTGGRPHAAKMPPPMQYVEIEIVPCLSPSNTKLTDAHAHTHIHAQPGQATQGPRSIAPPAPAASPRCCRRRTCVLLISRRRRRRRRHHQHARQQPSGGRGASCPARGPGPASRGRASRLGGVKESIGECYLGAWR
jgi:hypothetical protein